MTWQLFSTVEDFDNFFIFFAVLMIIIAFGYLELEISWHRRKDNEKWFTITLRSLVWRQTKTLREFQAEKFTLESSQKFNKSSQRDATYKSSENSKNVYVSQGTFSCCFVIRFPFREALLFHSRSYAMSKGATTRAEIAVNIFYWHRNLLFCPLKWRCSLFSPLFSWLCLRLEDSGGMFYLHNYITSLPRSRLAQRSRVDDEFSILTSRSPFN